MLLFMLSPKRLSIRDVARFLGNSTTDLRRTKEWLDANHISYETKGCDRGVSRWIFEFTLQLKLVEDLKTKYPSTWHKIYRAGATDIKMMNAVFEVHPPSGTKGNPVLNNGEIDFLK